MSAARFEHVQACVKCGGMGEVMGVAMRIYCSSCEGIGFFGLGGSSALPAGQMALAAEVRRLAELLAIKRSAAGVYVENERGAGRGSYAGD